MRSVITILRRLLESTNNLSKNEGYRQWAQTEYGKDWRYVYQHLVATNGKAPKSNDNLRGWV